MRFYLLLFCSDISLARHNDLSQQNLARGFFFLLKNEILILLFWQCVHRSPLQSGKQKSPVFFPSSPFSSEEHLVSLFYSCDDEGNETSLSLSLSCSGQQLRALLPTHTHEEDVSRGVAEEVWEISDLKK